MKPFSRYHLFQLYNDDHLKRKEKNWTESSLVTQWLMCRTVIPDYWNQFHQQCWLFRATFAAVELFVDAVALVVVVVDGANIQYCLESHYQEFVCQSLYCLIVRDQQSNSLPCCLCPFLHYLEIDVEAFGNNDLRIDYGVSYSMR